MSPKAAPSIVLVALNGDLSTWVIRQHLNIGGAIGLLQNVWWLNLPKLLLSAAYSRKRTADWDWDMELGCGTGKWNWYMYNDSNTIIQRELGPETTVELYAFLYVGL